MKILSSTSKAQTILLFVTLLAKSNNVDAFSLSSTSKKNIVPTFSQPKLKARSSISSTTSSLQSTIDNQSNSPIDLFKSFSLSDEEIKPIIRLGKDTPKEKVVNAFGLFTFFVSLITCPIWLVALKTIDTVCNMNEDLDPNRSVYDYAGKIWSRVWLSMAGSYPIISGDLDQISEGRGACLYIANHASWLDIPIVCTVLDPVFKFIAKGDLKALPCIGDQLVGGKHILIERDDRRSQLRTFKDGCNWLSNGVSVMAFPEGKRSDTGRLMEFKGGIFSMAVRSKVPIVPITIANAHAVMPRNALLPVQNGDKKLAVYVHPAIDVEGKTEEEISDLAREAILSKLPLDQQPLPSSDAEDEENKQKELQVS